MIGRVVYDGTSPEKVDWRTNDPAVLDLPRAQRRMATTSWSSFASGFDENGRFRIEDVAPGTYDLKIPLSLPSDKRTNGGPRDSMGEAILRVIVPEGPDDQPVDLGDVKAGLNVRVGDLAPDFTAPRVRRRPVQAERAAGQARLARLLGDVVRAMPRRDALGQGHSANLRRRPAVRSGQPLVRRCDRAPPRGMSKRTA